VFLDEYFTYFNKYINQMEEENKDQKSRITSFEEDNKRLKAKI